MREVATLSDEALERIDELGKGVLGVSRNLGTDATEATGALYQALSAGVPTDNAISFLEVASKAAIGGVTDTETAVDGLTTVMNAFSNQNVDAQKAADVMFATVKAGKTDFAQLSSSMFQVAPIANTLGVRFEEVGAGLATLTAQGTPTSVAATQMRSAMQSLVKPSEDLTKIFQEAGYESGEAAIAQLGFAGTAGIVREATGGSVAEMTKLLGSVEAVNAILGTTGPNADLFAGNLENMNNAAGSADKAFEVMADSFEHQWGKLTNTLNVLMIEIGTKLLPVITPLIEALGTHLLAAVDSLMPVFDALMNVFSGTEGSAGELKTALEAAFGPEVTAFILGVGETIGQFATVIVNDVVPAAVEFAGFLRETLIPVIESVAQFIGDNVIPAIETVAGLFQNEASDAVNQFGVGLDVLLTQLQPVFDALAKFWTEVEPLLLPAIENIGRIMGETFEGIQTVVVTVVGKIEEVIATLVEAWNTNFLGIQDVATTVFEVIGAAVAVFWELLTGAFKAGLQILAGDWDGAWTTLQETAASVRAIIEEAVSGFVANIQTWFATLQTQLATIAENIRKAVVDKFNELVTGAREKFTELVEMGLQKAQDLLRNISDEIGKLPGRVTTFLGTVVSTFRTTLTSLATSAVTWGADIVKGLIGGLLGQLDNLKNAAGDIAGAILDKIPNPFNFGSPSKLTTQWGEWIGEGMAAGLRNTTPMVAQASGRLGAAAVPVTHNHNSFNLGGITVQGGSTSAQTVDEIWREMERRANRAGFSLARGMA